MSLIDKFKRKYRKAVKRIKKIRLRPISVFLFHQVSDTFDETTMKKGDWSSTGQFKHNMEVLQKEYCFIPLDQAYTRMKKDIFRFRKYAVLTSDDGWASLKNVLPWLKEKGIPVTLFLNPGYFDGKHFRVKETEKYLLKADIDALAQMYPNVTIGSHGWEHNRATEQSVVEFRQSVKASVEALNSYSNYVPFFAYTYGSSNPETDEVLQEFGLVPVMIDREKNVDVISLVHRELIDGITL